MSYKVIHYKTSPVIDKKEVLSIDSDIKEIEDAYLADDVLVDKNFEKFETIFATEKLANMYAKNIPGAKVVECNVNCPEVQVKKLEPGKYSMNMFMNISAIRRMVNGHISKP